MTSGRSIIFCHLQPPWDYRSKWYTLHNISANLIEVDDLYLYLYWRGCVLQRESFLVLLCSWWRHQKLFSVIVFMMTSSNGNIFRVTGHLCGKFPAQRSVTRIFDVIFDLGLNKRLSKQCWGWSFETLSRSLWRHCNVNLRGIWIRQPILVRLKALPLELSFPRSYYMSIKRQ